MNNTVNEVDKIIPAKLSWRKDDQGNLVPVSDVFGDVYYSLADGLAESRYVFIEQNKLPQRFLALFEQQQPVNNSFTIAELGFGTGLNILATWQLWCQTKEKALADSVQSENLFQCEDRRKNDSFANQDPSAIKNGSLNPRLHLISTEKHPLTLQDLTRSLKSWEEIDSSLIPFIRRLLSLYPTLVSGCHRLHLADDVTLDLWLGDATGSLQKLASNSSSLYLSLNTDQATQTSKAIKTAPPRKIAHPRVDAWFLDGFAPSCNESLWAKQIFEQIQRLSKVDTTAATFSCAGVVKRGLEAAGFKLKKVKGFGRKREMLTAVMVSDTDSILKTKKNSTLKTNSETNTDTNPNIDTNEDQKLKSKVNKNSHYKKVAIIGAGVSGLMSAWSLAQRGLKVTLIDKSAPLAGASGNPRGLLAPKMTPVAHVAEHLHSIGYLYSQRLYRQLDERNQQNFNNDKLGSPSSCPSPIFSPTGTLDLLLKSNVDVAQIAEYPEQMAMTLATDKAKDVSGLKLQDLQQNLYLPQAGLVNPKALADTVLSHPNICFKVSEVKKITSNIDTENSVSKVQLHCEPTSKCQDSNYHTNEDTFDAIIIAAAYESVNLDTRIFKFRRIRGQLSWFEPSQAQLQALPKLPLKYGGYCAPFTPCENDEQLNSVTPGTLTFLLGASFIRNDMNTEIRESEHQVNQEKLIATLPELDSLVSNNIVSNNIVPRNDLSVKANEDTKLSDTSWHARVGIRAQTPDYHPLVGQIDDEGLIWTLSGMGSKGYAFAPICAEVLADMMTGQFIALPSSLLARLSPQRKTLQKPLKP